MRVEWEESGEREREREREKRGRRFSMQHYFEARREDPISYGTSSAMDFTGEVLVLSIGSVTPSDPRISMITCCAVTRI